MDNAKTFITAGKATFTIEMPEAIAKKHFDGRKHYTYGVNKKESTSERYPDDIYFVSLYSRIDGSKKSIYLGLLNPETGEIKETRNSASPEMVPFRFARFAFKHIWKNGAMPEGYEVNHTGSCGQCGRELTTPESIKTGFGPVCAKRLGIPHGNDKKEAGDEKT